MVSIPEHDEFGWAISYDVMNDFHSNILAVLHLQRLVVPSHKLVLHEAGFFSTDVMTLFEDRCLSSTVKTTCILKAVLNYRQSVLTDYNDFACT